MNDLAKRLRALAGALDKHAAGFEGKSWNRAAVSFAKALARFESQVLDAEQGLAPGLNDLMKLMESPAKKALDEDAMKELFKDILDHKAPHDQTPARLRALFLAELKAGKGSATKALAAVQKIVQKSQTPKEKVPKDAEKLKLEFYRLGGLEEKQLAYELHRRFKDKDDLRRLAEAVGVPVPEDAKKHVLSAAIMALAKRVHGHILVGDR